MPAELEEKVRQRMILATGVVNIAAGACKGFADASGKPIDSNYLWYFFGGSVLISGGTQATLKIIEKNNIDWTYKTEKAKEQYGTKIIVNKGIGGAIGGGIFSAVEIAVGYSTGYIINKVFF